MLRMNRSLKIAFNLGKPGDRFTAQSRLHRGDDAPIQPIWPR
jgi:hypothetical protein